MKKCYTILFFTCLASMHLSAQNYAWTHTFGGISQDLGYTVVVDSSGNVLVGGTFANDSVDFDPGPGTDFLIENDGEDIFFAKYDSAGNYLWARAITGPGNDRLISLTVDGMNNVYIVGFFMDTVDFDPSPAVANLTTTSGQHGAYLAKYDSNGNYLWAHAFDSNEQDGAYGVKTDAMGNVYVAGFYSGTIDFDPGASVANLSPVSSTWDLFLAKYDPNGNYIWAKSMGGSGSEFTSSLYIDASSNLYITGYFAGIVDFDPSPAVNNLVSTGGSESFFAKYDSSGNYIWAKNISAAMSFDVIYGLAVDQAENVFICGHFALVTDFDPSMSTANLTPVGSSDIFLAKYDNMGNYIFANKIGDAGEDHAYGIATDVDNNIYLTGSFRNTVDFDPGTGSFNIPSTGGSDFFLATYSNNGDFLSVKPVGGTGEDVGLAVAISPNNDIWVTGWFHNAVDFNPAGPIDNKISNGAEDVFLTKYIMPVIPSSVDENNVSDISLKVYPNPNNGLFVCEVLASTKIFVYNASGSLVFNQELYAGQNTIDLSAQPAGVYFLRSDFNNGLVLVKQ